MSETEKQTRPRAKPGRKPNVPDLNRVVAAVMAGEYDEELLRLVDALRTREESRKAAVMKLVHETFGDQAEVVVSRSVPTQRTARTAARGVPNPDNNPFIKTGMTKEAEAASDEPLPGPYRNDPKDGNSYRRDLSVETPVGMVAITDIFGGHSAAISVDEWNSWVDVEQPTVDPLAKLDDVEQTMSEERQEPPQDQPQVTPLMPEQTTTVQPDIERRGAAISGLHSSDIEG